MRAGPIFRRGEQLRPNAVPEISGALNILLADMFGLYFLERLFDTASTAVIAGLGLLLFQTHAQHAASSAESARTTGALTTAARTTGTRILIFR